MSFRITRSLSGMCLAVALLSSAAAHAQAAVEKIDGGIVKVRSAYSVDETIARLEKDIAGKGIVFFMAVDQAKLAADAGIKLRASTLLVFGNPPLGAQFITSNPQAGLDWPVRLLVSQDEAGVVWASYTDFAWIARRHHIADRDEQFRKASSVVESITSSVGVK
ncbi:Uncharacterized conserved protein, DUF302 family [Burkholderia sp. YR290]|jgi:uncharacterized protein (DUF302 family)|nr:Uncharacterized conserved protein, DUF302 family [Burkholderia sp. YR290]